MYPSFYPTIENAVNLLQGAFFSSGNKILGVRYPGKKTARISGALFFNLWRNGREDAPARRWNVVVAGNPRWTSGNEACPNRTFLATKATRRAQFVYNDSGTRDTRGANSCLSRRKAEKRPRSVHWRCRTDEYAATVDRHKSLDE